MTNYQFSEGFHGSLVWYYTSYVKWLDGTEVDPIQRVDLQLKKQFKLNDLEGDVAFIVHNLFDKYYLEFQENQYYDRRAFLKLRLAF